jgi:hypothetical protein
MPAEPLKRGINTRRVLRTSEEDSAPENWKRSECGDGVRRLGGGGTGSQRVSDSIQNNGGRMCPSISRLPATKLAANYKRVISGNVSLLLCHPLELSPQPPPCSPLQPLPAPSSPSPTVSVASTPAQSIPQLAPRYVAHVSVWSSSFNVRRGCGVGLRGGGAWNCHYNLPSPETRDSVASCAASRPRIPSYRLRPGTASRAIPSARRPPPTAHRPPPSPTAVSKSTSPGWSRHSLQTPKLA